MTTVIRGPVDVPVVDTHGAALRLLLADGGHAAVAVQPLRLAHGWELTLEVLAASHRVHALRHGAPLAIETVACGADRHDVVDADGLPGRHRWSLPDGGNGRFDSTMHHGADAITAARRAWERSQSEPFVVRFPNHPDAITAMVADDATPHTIGWRTWHCYPGDDAHVVRTHTRLAAAPARTPQEAER